MNKRISLVVTIALLVATAGYLVWARATEDERTLADPDCPSDAPIMTLNIAGDLRQDNVAVLRRGGRIDVLTDDDASFDASFSPDGRQMVFTTGREGSHEETLGFSQLQIYLMNSDGSDERRLLEEQRPEPEVSHAVDFGREGRTGPVPSSGASPDWSPDGSEIAFTQGPGRLMVVAASGGEPREIHGSDVGIEHIEWSPEGDRIAFFRSEKLHVIDVDSGKLDVLATGIPRPTGLGWSPDGDTLTYGTDEGIYTLSVKEPDPRLFARGGLAPAWSPDGDAIAYFDDDEAREFTRKLMVRPLDGGEPKRVKVDHDSLYSFETNLEWLRCADGR